jgi:hypothetical protein
MVGRVWPRHGHRGRPLNSVVRPHVNQRWLAIVVGTLAVYILVHAAMVGYAAFLLWDAERGPPPIDLSPEMRETYHSLLTGLVIFGTFGILSAGASIGLYRGWSWARHVWVGTSVALVACAVFATITLKVPWTQYLYEIGMVLTSWGFMIALAKDKREA